MKKYLLSALALPLLFACSDELIEKEVTGNDQFAGIEKVNATFYLDEGPITRMDKTGWTLENGDLYGFAWMGDVDNVGIDGKAYQNHNLIQTNGRFEPQTSIYVGKYYIYRPYDYETVSPQAINFNSLKEQPMAEGFASTTDAWKALAKSAIIIADKWTDITLDGRTYGTDPTIWDQPGIAKPYKVFAALFSNQTGLDLTYENNNPTFDADKNVKGATDIDYNILTGDAAGAADIYGATVQLAGAANAFTYAPREEPNQGEHNGEFWANKDKTTVDGFTFAEAVEPIVLNAPVDKPIGTGDEGSKGWFWFNSLPVTGGDAAMLTTTVVTTIKTSYGTVTIGGGNEQITLEDCAYAFEYPSPTATSREWIKLAAANELDKAKDKKKWTIDGHNTFVNQFGNHKGKYALDVDFSTAVMDIHIKNDAHLQKYLKFYMASGKQDAVELVLDGASATDKSFKLSKISIALLQTINRGAENKVLVKACDEADHNAPEGGQVKIIVTQDGQAEVSPSQAAKKEVPALNDVFAEPTPVYLAAATDWTWGGEYDGEGTDDNEPLPIDENVASLTNEGNITVNASNVQLSVIEVEEGEEQPTIYNAKGATMTLTKVTTVKNNLNNLGTINVPAETELRAYDIDITNDAKTILTPENIIAKTVPADGEVGIINNSGVVGVSDGTEGRFFNYGGMIYMQTNDAITLLTSNELIAEGAESAFSTAFGEDNKMGTVVLPEGNPYAIVSVANRAENGFITYDWTAATYEHDPGNVKYNTIVVSNDITFTGDVRSSEIQFIMFNGVKTKVVNPGNPLTASRLNMLKGVIVPDGKSFILEKTNRLNCTVGAFVGEGSTIYKGGELLFPDGSEANYFGDWTLDQIVKW